MFIKKIKKPFCRVLEESLHFWKWRDDADIQSFDLVFPIWVPPEENKKKETGYEAIMA